MKTLLMYVGSGIILTNRCSTRFNQVLKNITQINSWTQSNFLLISSRVDPVHDHSEFWDVCKFYVDTHQFLHHKGRNCPPKPNISFNFSGKVRVFFSFSIFFGLLSTDNFCVLSVSLGTAERWNVSKYTVSFLLLLYYDVIWGNFLLLLSLYMFSFRYKKLLDPSFQMW